MMNAGSWLHDAIMWVHIDSGMVALASGTIAAVMRKGGGMHVLAGKWFVGAMLVLGITASILGPFREEPESPVGGMLVCYFVLTGWLTARRRGGTAGLFEILACLFVLGAGAATAFAAFTGDSTTPAGAGPLFIFAAACLLAGLGDIRTILGSELRPAQRLTRHIWRICAALFVATGSFFIGQQDVMPEAVRGSPFLFVLGFAPLALMAFWLVRIRFAKALRRLTLRTPALPVRAPADQPIA